jgi:capsular polysaccharide biosynthesis protein
MKSLLSSIAVVRRRWRVVVVTLVVGLVAVSFLYRFMPRAYEAAAQVLIVNESDGRDPSVSSIDLPAVATSTVVLSHVISDLKIPVSLIDLKKGIKARVGSRSSIMEISYRDASPDRAVAVPNAVADELAQYYASISTGRAQENVRKLDAEIVSTRRRLQQINDQISDVTAKYPYLGSDHALDTVTERLDDLQTQRQMAAAAMEGDVAATDAVSPNSRAMSQIARHEILQGDDLNREIVSGSAKDAATLAFDQTQYTDIYPGLRALQRKVKSERALVAAEQTHLLHSPDAFSESRASSALEALKAQAVVTGDRSKVAALDSLIAATHEHLEDLPTATKSFTWLRLQRDAAQADYLTLSSRRTAAIADRAEALSLGSVVVFDRAVRADAAVVGLGRGSLTLATAAIVLVFALCMAFVAESLDPRLRRADQIERLYGTAVIGSLGGKG